MINFIVVDDNDKHRKKNVKFILDYMMKNNLDFDIHEYNDYSDKLISDIEKFGDSSIYVIDLELPSGDGLDIARTIRNEYNNWVSPIVIITSHTSLYYEVYKERLQILDFIGKCEDIQKNLVESVQICIRMFNKNNSYRYVYKNIEYTVPYNEINYIQREGRRTRIVTSKNDYYQNISVNIIKELLPKYFIISSKGVLINMRNVDKIDWSNNLVYFKDGNKAYIVSKSHKKEIESYEFV